MNHRTAIIACLTTAAIVLAAHLAVWLGGGST